ncbi:MAG: hypothetical protein ACR2G4_07610 [Pyrinomonadaceae bacterium]
MNFITLCLLFVVFVGVQVGGCADEGACESQSLDLRVGQEISVAGQQLKIKFVAVREDSRCPVGVNCIWAGNARIALKLTQDETKTAEVELNTANESREASYANYIVKLVDLAPRPVEGKKLDAGDYVATLAVTKKS